MLNFESEDKTEIDPQSIEITGFPRNGATLEENPNVRRLILINESGLYSAIFNSKLPSAKKFKRWVTAEVLPAIRKHGAYMTSETIEKVLSDPDTIYEIASQLNMNPAAVRYYSTPTYAKRAKSDDVRRLIPIDSKEDEEHTDCFAYTGKPCSALTVTRCNWSRCSFYKPKER